MFSTIKRTILFLFDLSGVLPGSVAVRENGDSVSILNVGFGQVVEKVVWSYEEIASVYWFDLVLREYLALIIQSLMILDEKLRFVDWIFTFPPSLQTRSLVYFQNPRTLAPLVVHIRWVHLFHFKIIKNRYVRFYLGCRKTCAYSFRWYGDHVNWVGFEVLVLLRGGKVCWDEVDFVLLVE